MLYLNNDNLLGLDGLTDALAGTPVTTATVTCTLLDAGRQPYPGPVTVTLVYVANSPGNYRAVLPYTALVGLQPNTEVYLRYAVTANGGAGGWDVPETVGYRR